MKSALITGGAGFLGTHLVEKLLNDDFSVIVIDDFSTARPEHESFLKNLSGKIKLIKADVTQDWADWASQIPSAWLSNLEYVFHWASPASPPLFDKLALDILAVNSVGLQKALAFADRYGARLIFASTSEVYGDPLVSPQSENYWGNVNPFGPRSCYDEAKRFGEALIFSWNKKYNTRHGLVRIFNTYGPRMNPRDGRVVNRLLLQAIQGEPLTVHGHGNQTRSFCYVDDLIEGVMSYAYSELQQPLNIGNPNEISIRQLVQEIQKIFPEKILNTVFNDLPDNDPQRRQPDISKALDLLNPWQPKTSLSDGLRKTAAWLQSEKLALPQNN